jgi:hypothetical protein
MATTPVYNWPTPDDTDLVKDGAKAIRDLGNAIDTTVSSVPTGLVHIKTTSFSAVAAVTEDNVFTSEYDTYILNLNITGKSTSEVVNFRMRKNATSETSAAYGRSGLITTTAPGITANYQASQTSGIVSTNVINARPAFYELKIANPIVASNTFVISQGVFENAGDASLLNIQTTTVDLPTDYDGITIFCATNFTGTLSIYGFRKS